MVDMVQVVQARIAVQAANLSGSTGRTADEQARAQQAGEAPRDDLTHPSGPPMIYIPGVGPVDSESYAVLKTAGLIKDAGGSEGPDARASMQDDKGAATKDEEYPAVADDQQGEGANISGPKAEVSDVGESKDAMEVEAENFEARLEPLVMADQSSEKEGEAQDDAFPDDYGFDMEATGGKGVADAGEAGSLESSDEAGYLMSRAKRVRMPYTDYQSWLAALKESDEREGRKTALEAESTREGKGKKRADVSLKDAQPAKPDYILLNHAVARVNGYPPIVAGLVNQAVDPDIASTEHRRLAIKMADKYPTPWRMTLRIICPR